MEFVNGKDDIPYMKWKIIQMFETTNHYQQRNLSVSTFSTFAPIGLKTEDHHVRRAECGHNDHGLLKFPEPLLTLWNPWTNQFPCKTCMPYFTPLGIQRLLYIYIYIHTVYIYIHKNNSRSWFIRPCMMAFPVLVFIIIHVFLSPTNPWQSTDLADLARACPWCSRGTIASGVSSLGSTSSHRRNPFADQL